MKNTFVNFVILAALIASSHPALGQQNFDKYTFSPTTTTAPNDATDHFQLVQGGAIQKVSPDIALAPVVPQMILNGASPNQAVNCQFGNTASNFLQGGGSCALTDKSGAKFTASISGTTMHVTAVSSGTLAPNL
jgi:hypothetical protein